MHPRQFQLNRQTFSPDDGGGSPPAAPAANPIPPTGGTGDPPLAPPSGDPPADPVAPDPAAPDPAIEAARAVVPADVAAYQVNLPPEFAKFAGDATDPAMVALREHALANQWSQGRFDDTMDLIKVFAGKGMLDQVYDPAAEAAKLGDTAVARRQEVETFATALKDRGEIDEAEFAELTTLAMTAAGVTLAEKLRKMMGPGGGGPTLPDPNAGGPSAAMEAARAQRLDPKYETDGNFRRAADAAWIAAFNAERAQR